MNTVHERRITCHFAPNNLYNYFQNKNERLYQLKKDAYEWMLAIVFKDIPDFKSVHGMMNYVARKLMYVALQEPERYIVMTATNVRTSIIGFVRLISAQKKLTKEQADDYLDYFLSILFSGLKNQ